MTQSWFFTKYLKRIVIASYLILDFKFPVIYLIVNLLHSFRLVFCLKLFEEMKYTGDIVLENNRSECIKIQVSFKCTVLQMDS